MWPDLERWACQKAGSSFHEFCHLKVCQLPIGNRKVWRLDMFYAWLKGSQARLQCVQIQLSVLILRLDVHVNAASAMMVCKSLSACSMSTIDIFLFRLQVVQVK